MSHQTSGRVSRAKTFRGAITLFIALFLAVGSTVLEAQVVDDFPGVSLTMVYELGSPPALAIKPMTGRFGGAALAPSVEAILGRDLRYSDRFVVMDSIPEVLVGETLDYGLWERLGAFWLLTGSVEGGGGGESVLVLQLHDVIYAEVREEGRFRIPASPTHPDFRMAVHRVSDQVVEWVFDEPGMAASRISFAMRRSDGTKEIYVIDSDGENLQRVTSTGGVAVSPAWAPDGKRLLYQTWEDGETVIREMDLESGRIKRIPPFREGILTTPSYHPNGSVVAYSVQGGTRSGLYTYDLGQDCCLTNLTESRRIDISPVFSPDGRQMAFNSSRLGEPQILVMPSAGGPADPVSPYRFGQEGYYTSPDWGPFDDLIAFHGRITQRGRHQILVARLGEQNRVTRLTDEGNNEDPSFAPDGRHLTFWGERSWGKGLFVVDLASGRERTLLSGVEVSNPDWSPLLGGR